MVFLFTGLLQAGPLASLSLDGHFGEVELGKSSTRTLTIYNYGDAPLVVSKIEINNPHFTGSWSGTIPARSNVYFSQEVVLTFRPTEPENPENSQSRVFSGTLALKSNSDGGGTLISVVGELATAELQMEGWLDLAAKLGESETRIITVKNAGEIDFNLTSVTLPAAVSVDFDRGVITAGESKDIEVTFAPTQQSDYVDEALLTFNTDSVSYSPNTVRIRTRENYLLLKGKNNLGAVQLGQTATMKLTISNQSDRYITISSVEYPEGFSGELARATISPYTATLIKVSFTPVADKIYTGEIIIHSDAGNRQTDKFYVVGAGPYAYSFVIMRDAQYFGSNYYESDWFGGFFKATEDPTNTYVYSMDFGWAWMDISSTASQHDQGLWFWSFNMESWLWGSSGSGRFMYNNTDNSWIYVESAEGGSWIRNSKTGQWTFNPSSGVRG